VKKPKTFAQRNRKKLKVPAKRKPAVEPVENLMVRKDQFDDVLRKMIQSEPEKRKK